MALNDKNNRCPSTATANFRLSGSQLASLIRFCTSRVAQLVLPSSPHVPKEKGLDCLKQIIFNNYHMESADDSPIPHLIRCGVFMLRG